MCHPTGLCFWSFWFRTGCPFQRRFLERGIIFRTHKSSSFVSSHLKSFKDRLLLKIRFNALANCCTLVAPCVLACRAGIFWREPRAVTPPSWINRKSGTSPKCTRGRWRRAQNCGSRLFLLLKIVADYEEAFIWCISRTNEEISLKKNRAISIYKLSRTEYKKLAHF